MKLSQKVTTWQERINSLQYKKQIEDLNINLQTADLCLSKMIQYGFLIQGDTKSGKTALAYILSQNLLKVSKINGQVMVTTPQSDNKNARIGNSIHSETLFPNMFPVKLKKKPQQQFTLIDMPGYKDPEGLFKIYAKIHCHYKIYSKTKNIKFLLTFDVNQLQNTCQDFIKTIVRWISSFNDYQKLKKQIFKSVAFVITKVQDSVTIKEDLIAKLKSIVQQIKTYYDKNLEDAVKDLIQFIITKDRLFYLKKINDQYKSQQLLEQIDRQISHWWTRQYDSVKQQVDMKDLSFSIGLQINLLASQYPNTCLQLNSLIEYYDIKIKELASRTYQGEIKYSLKFVIQQLIYDAMGHPDSLKFIEIMKNYINLYYYKYDKCYYKDREKVQSQLFRELFPSQDHNLVAIQGQQFQRQNNQQGFIINQENHFVKKFQSLQKIQCINSQIFDLKIQNQKQLNILRIKMDEIIQQFNHVVINQTLASQVIYKYGYLIHRLFQEIKIFNLLVYNCTTSYRWKIIQKGGIFSSFFIPFTDSMGQHFRHNSNEVSYSQLHAAFINKFDFNDIKYKQILINEDLVNFFLYYDIKEQYGQDSQDGIKNKMEVVLRYSDKVLEALQHQSNITLDKSIAKLISMLKNCRLNCESMFFISRLNQDRNKAFFVLRKTTKNLAKLLQSLGQLRLSRQVYKTINFVNSVCKLYQQELNLLNMTNQKTQESEKTYLELKQQYTRYVKVIYRDIQNIQLLQEQFEQVNNSQELQKVRQQIFNKINQQIRSITEYEQNLFNDGFRHFQNKLLQDLQKYYRSVG